MSDPKYMTLLSYYNASSGVIPIVNKPPPHLQHKWTSRAQKYKKAHNVTFPPLTEFCNFKRQMSSLLNDLGFSYGNNILITETRLINDHMCRLLSQ